MTNGCVKDGLQHLSTTNNREMRTYTVKLGSAIIFYFNFVRNRERPFAIANLVASVVFTILIIVVIIVRSTWYYQQGI